MRRESARHPLCFYLIQLMTIQVVGIGADAKARLPYTTKDLDLPDGERDITHVGSFLAMRTGNQKQCPPTLFINQHASERLILGVQGVNLTPQIFVVIQPK